MLRRPRLRLRERRKQLVLEEFEPPVRFWFCAPTRSTEARTWHYRTAINWRRPCVILCRPAFFAPAGAGQCGVETAALGLDGLVDVVGRRPNPRRALGSCLHRGARSAPALATRRVLLGFHAGAAARNAAAE